MIIRKLLYLVLLFYFLFLLQISFLVHFNVWGVVPNFILIVFVIINFIRYFDKEVLITGSFVIGSFLDIFSSHFIGFSVLILLGITFFVRFILTKYVQIF